MNEEVYTVALKSALTEIKNICPDIRRSLILMNNGTLITADDQSLDPNMENAVSSLKDLAEKASSVGGLEGLLIDGENGKVHASRINGMYFITALSKQSDLTYLRTVTGVILPTIIKVLDSLSPEAVSPTPLKPAQRLPYVPYKPSISEPIEEEKVEEQVEEVESPTPLEEATKTSEVEEIQETPETENEAELELESPKKITNLPSQQLIVDKFGGLMVRSDTIQIDYEVLQRWGSLLDVKDIREVDIETFKGKTSRCKAKVISDPKLEGRGLIRIPEKMCDTLEVKRGELVRVKPVIEESD